jgi:hypothetical protein
MQRRRATIVIVSDFLGEGNWSPVLSTLARRHEVHGIVVHDPLDVGFSGLGMVEVVDSETGDAYLLDGPSWGSQQGVKGRVSALERLGVRTLALSTADDAHHALQLHFQKVRGRR